MNGQTRHKRDIREVNNLLTRAILLLDRIGNENSVLRLLKLKTELAGRGTDRDLCKDGARQGEGAA